MFIINAKSRENANKIAAKTCTILPKQGVRRSKRAVTVLYNGSIDELLAAKFNRYIVYIDKNCSVIWLFDVKNDF